MKKAIKRQVSRAVRFAAREWNAELRRVEPAGVSPLVRVDMVDAVRQLGTRAVNEHLVQFYGWNHRWVAQLSERNRRAAVSTYDFIDADMPGAVYFANQMDVIRSKSEAMMELGGQILDLGVYKGGSTRALARIFPDQVIHGFDSFEGLPEDWSHVLKGEFGETKGALPDMPDNVKLYKGWFDDTLPVWLEGHGDRPISVLRVDCDIYSSTKTIFSVLRPLIVPGTWIVFDELIGYRGWQDHEFKAFSEFLADTGFSAEYVSYGLTYTIARLTDGSPTSV
jgi:hypothetical protein